MHEMQETEMHEKFGISIMLRIFRVMLDEKYFTLFSKISNEGILGRKISNGGVSAPVGAILRAFSFIQFNLKFTYL